MLIRVAFKTGSPKQKQLNEVITSEFSVMTPTPDTHGLSSARLILPVRRPAWPPVLAASAWWNFHWLSSDSARNAHLRQVLDLGA